MKAPSLGGVQRALLRSAVGLALLLVGAPVLVACGATHLRASSDPKPSRAVNGVQRRRVFAEASDLNEWTTCSGWLAASPTARETYLRRNWPNLSGAQAQRATRMQSLGCAASPGPAGSSMATLQAAVDLSILHFNGIYDELVEEGLKENPEAFVIRIGGSGRAPAPTPPRPKFLRRGSARQTPAGG
jgi:hypothetical protein